MACVPWDDGGRRTEDPFRGLRAGPVRTSPRHCPSSPPSHSKNGPHRAEVCLEVSAQTPSVCLNRVFPECMREPADVRGDMAGAGGFEPPPSALTVRCPTGWTTPQWASVLYSAMSGCEAQRPGPPLLSFATMPLRHFLTGGLLDRDSPQGSSTSYPASIQARQPPSIETTLR